MRLFVLLLLATAAACAQSGAAPAHWAAPPAEKTATATGALAASSPSASVQRVRKAIDWNAAAAHPALAALLPPVQSQVFRRSQLPVLLPSQGPWVGDGIATAEADWYTLSTRVGERTVVVQGDRVATLDPEMVPPHWAPPTWDQPLVTRNEGIVEATFLAFGASYVVAVECAFPDSDPHCTEDGFVLDLVAALRRWSPPAEVEP